MTTLPSFKRSLLLSISVVIFLPIYAGLSWGFSLGKINVASQLGEEFYAEIPVMLDGQYPLSSVIGSSSDYERLGLTRDPVVDKLTISLGVTSDVEGVIKLSSSEKIAKPSLNILIKASHNGGTILENYLVAVDYNQSLSLAVPIKKKGEAPAPLAVQAEDKTFKDDIAVDDAEPAAAPVFVPSHKAENRVTAFPQASEEKGGDYEEETVEKRGSIIRVRGGANLYRVARDLGATDANIQQIVVAIWSLNIDKFENGNMHRIEEGAEMRTDGVTKKAKTIPAKEAKKIIQAQWMDANHLVKLLEIDDAIAGNIFSLPIEEFNAEEKDVVYARVLEWKKRWLSYDVDSLMELYSSKFGDERYDVDKWKDLKKRLGDKHGEFKVDIGDVHIQWMGDVVVASFPQRFKSNVMDRIGTKVLYFVYEEGSLKIVDEFWLMWDYKPAGYPFVVGVASHSLFDNMMDRMDIMRRKGYSAYNVSFMNKGRKYHKIFVERFSSKEEASAFAEKLLKDKIADYAFPMNAPYYVEAGSYKRREEAIYTIKRLASVGYTSYPLVTCKEQACNYKIIVGAFKDRGSALFLSNKLGKAGLGGSSVRP